MLVVRVENAVGSGPYQMEGHQWNNPDIVDQMGWAHADEAHPTLREDSYRDHEGNPIWQGERYANEKYCGFADHRAMRSWFGRKWRIALDEEGFELVEFEVPPMNVLIGTKQVLFPRFSPTTLVVGRQKLI